jgi:hypothetical protein
MNTSMTSLPFPPDIVEKFPPIHSLIPDLPLSPTGSLPRNRGRNRVKKGEGPESRRHAPDPHDTYPYQTASRSYARLRLFGHENLSLIGVVQLATAVEQIIIVSGQRIPPRKRAAKRRKPNAFYWFDENWNLISPVFDRCLQSVVACPQNSL